MMGNKPKLDVFGNTSKKNNMRNGNGGLKFDGNGPNWRTAVPDKKAMKNTKPMSKGKSKR